MKKNSVDLTIVETTTPVKYNWVDICNAWLSGGAVNDAEIAYIATLNIIDLCGAFKTIVRHVVCDYCEQYAEEWNDRGYPLSWGYRLNNGAILKMYYGGWEGDYWNNSEHYSIAE